VLTPCSALVDGFDSKASKAILPTVSGPDIDYTTLDLSVELSWRSDQVAISGAMGNCRLALLDSSAR
jgi:hypothetical protein